MPTLFSTLLTFSLNWCCILLFVGAAYADENESQRTQLEQQYIASLERLALAKSDGAVVEFERLLSPDLKRQQEQAERQRLFALIQSAMQQAGGVLLEKKEDVIAIHLHGVERYVLTVGFEQQHPFRINKLQLEKTENPASIELSRANIAQVMEDMEQQGFTGVLQIKLDDELVLKRAYGTTSPQSQRSIELNTIFGIGSTPIDFTIAATYLLEQQGKISLSDSIGNYFPDIPDDKASITIRHLLSGQSGLPDFHHNDSDWDADLAWIDRQEAEQRILNQSLLFAPGEGQAHSHSAFVLLSALIERVSKNSYLDFIQQHFLKPAGMTRTGLYGQNMGFPLDDFAIGGGPSFVGEPNIPVNWGPTSWLIMGSGGMYSTLPDMLAFYDYVRSGKVLNQKYSAHFKGLSVGIGGSDRGFYLFHAYNGGHTEVMLLSNLDGRGEILSALSLALQKLVETESTNPRSAQ